MIPQEQLVTLKPFQDQINRKHQVDSKRKSSFKKGRLTHRARQWAAYIGSCKNPKYPKGERWLGNLPIKERQKKDD